MTAQKHERQWYSREELTDLIRAAVGVFDHSEITTVRRIKAQRQPYDRTAVATEDLERLMQTIDQLVPGTMDNYLNYRLELQAQRKAEKRRS